MELFSSPPVRRGPRTLLALQSNDKINEPDHINCVKTGQELAQQAHVKELYGGKKRFNEGTPDEYTRYMILGKWYGNSIT